MLALCGLSLGSRLSLGSGLSLGSRLSLGSGLGLSSRLSLLSSGLSGLLLGYIIGIDRTGVNSNGALGEILDSIVNDYGIVDEVILSCIVGTLSLHDLNVKLNYGLALRALEGIEGYGDEGDSALFVFFVNERITGGRVGRVAVDAAAAEGLGSHVGYSCNTVGSTEDHVLLNAAVLVEGHVDAGGLINLQNSVVILHDPLSVDHGLLRLDPPSNSDLLGFGIEGLSEGGSDVGLRGYGELVTGSAGSGLGSRIGSRIGNRSGSLLRIGSRLGSLSGLVLFYNFFTVGTPYLYLEGSTGAGLVVKLAHVESQLNFGAVFVDVEVDVASVIVSIGILANLNGFAFSYAEVVSPGAVSGKLELHLRSVNILVLDGVNAGCLFGHDVGVEVPSLVVKESALTCAYSSHLLNGSGAEVMHFYMLASYGYLSSVYEVRIKCDSNIAGLVDLENDVLAVLVADPVNGVHNLDGNGITAGGRSNISVHLGVLAVFAERHDVGCISCPCLT